MIRARCERWICRLLVWLDAKLIAPALVRLVAVIRQEHAHTLREVHALTRTSEQRVLDYVRIELDALHALVDARAPTAAQTAAFSDRLDHVDDRLAHLAALMFGKSIAARVATSRGPREFTHEERQ